MKSEVISINIEPKEALALIDKNYDGTKMDSSIYEVKEGKYIISTTYILSVTVTLVVILDNVQDTWTKVKIIKSGFGSDEFWLNNSKGLNRDIKDILKKYIIK